MYYHKHSPSFILAPYVECYFTWDSEGPLEKELVVESPPSGFCSIVFNYGDTYALQNKKYERLEVPRQFVAGQSVYSYTLFLRRKIGIAGIVLKPTALATIFQLPVVEFTEERIDLYAVFKKELIDEIVEQMRSAVSEVERVRFLESFILNQYQLKKPVTDFIDKAANFISENNGMLLVTDLLKDSCMSRRTFERKFLQKVGLSPKYYARIRRIVYICNIISGKKKADWPTLFTESRFYDQAHFIRDFEEFTGRSPQKYLKQNNELTNLVEKATTIIFNLPVACCLQVDAFLQYTT